MFNETRVIHARLLLQKETGASIEVLMLHPRLPYADMQQGLSVQGSAVWECMIGNKKRWKEGEVLQLHEGPLQVLLEWYDREQNLVRLRWEPVDMHLAAVLETLGKIPIPPYLGREATERDNEVYQTVYARTEGSVAAPTAGLHFTPSVLDKLRNNGAEFAFLTLHVGAGTFQPVKEEDASKHNMHREYVIFTRTTIATLRKHVEHVLPVGTTSLRSLESLYWFGAGLLSGELERMDIPQDFAYRERSLPSPTAAEALDAVLTYMDTHQLQQLEGYTAIYILPGYTLRMPMGLVTNFHQPGSTLMLLVAALVGSDWRVIYNEALTEGYRFLSYGDSSLLLP